MPMYLPCFYTKYIRFTVDFLFLGIAGAVLSGSLITGVLVSVSISLLNYAFRFYSRDDIRSLNGSVYFFLIVQSILVHLLVYGGLYFLRGKTVYVWMYYAAGVTFLLPFFSWYILDLFALHLGHGTRVYLYGTYPQFSGIIEGIEQAGRCRLTIYQGEKTELSPQEKRHDGKVLFTLCEAAFRKIPIDIAAHFEELFTVNTQIWYVPMKRLADIIITLCSLVLFAVPMLLVALFIYLEDREHVVFRQVRIGQKGKPFILYKFRSMRNTEFLEHDPNANIETRVLKIGQLIRRTRLDETLQFFNVLKGDMSIIGPRPEMEFYHNKSVQEIPCYMYRLDVKPGITGWAQTCFIHTSSMDQYREKTAYDLYYVKKFNPVLDIQILIKTIGTIFLLIGSR
ncbi:MAG: sugar transferase [Spirochaetales bacterium]|nr:sugar transferase [Spirochaetales bacterium]